jgi:hypothetical protein
MVRTATGYVPISQSEVTEDVPEVDAEKLAKGAIVMLPPAGGAPRRFTIGATTFTPNLAGQLIVFSEGDAAELETEGWKRSTKEEKHR